MTTTVREIVERKPDVYAVRPEDTVHQALQVMAEKNIGAVLVMSGDEIIGCSPSGTTLDWPWCTATHCVIRLCAA